MHNVTVTVSKTPPYKAVQNLKICRRKNVILRKLLHLNNVVLNFTEF